jgi:hypothetical protein
VLKILNIIYARLIKEYIKENVLYNIYNILCLSLIFLSYYIYFIVVNLANSDACIDFNDLEKEKSGLFIKDLC